MANENWFVFEGRIHGYYIFLNCEPDFYKKYLFFLF